MNECMNVLFIPECSVFDPLLLGV